MSEPRLQTTDQDLLSALVDILRNAGWRDTADAQWSGLVGSIPTLQTLFSTLTLAVDPTPMLLWCPECGERHIDVGEFATKEHHTHACQHCGMVWRPAIGPTFGVQWLPGFKDRGRL